MLLPFFCRRVLQSRFATERNWEQYHTPRNLLLAMVSYTYSSTVAYASQAHIPARETTVLCVIMCSCLFNSYAGRRSGRAIRDIVSASYVCVRMHLTTYTGPWCHCISVYVCSIMCKMSAVYCTCACTPNTWSQQACMSPCKSHIFVCALCNHNYCAMENVYMYIHARELLYITVAVSGEVK